MSDIRLVEGKDEDGNEVKVYVKKPTSVEYRDSQVEYNKTFRSALESGALLKKKLVDYMKDQGIWDEKKQAEYDRLVEKIQQLEGVLDAGGIPLVEAKNTAFDLKQARGEFRLLIAERTALDSNTAEGQADNARFTSLLAQCILKEDGRNRVFADIDSYEESAAQPWAVQAASELANMLYALDPAYDKNLKENQFLVNYGFANEDLQLTNSDGHLIDIDEDGVERLIDKEGRFIKYDDDGNALYINRKGEEVDEDGKAKVAFQPFFDDKGKPVDVPVTEEETAEETSEETAESEEETPAPKKRGRPKKSEETV